MKKYLLLLMLMCVISITSCTSEELDENEPQLTNKCNSVNSGHVCGPDCDDDDNGEG